MYVATLSLTAQCSVSTVIPLFHTVTAFHISYFDALEEIWQGEYFTEKGH